MTGNILCAIDITRTDESATVLKAAQRIAALDGSALTVLTVVPDFGASLVGAYFEEHHVSTAKDKASDHLRDVIKQTLGDEAAKAAKKVVSVGRVYEEVLKVSKLDNSELIVIGAHRPDLKDYLLGPNAARVVRHSSCSVYVVR